MGDRRWEIRDVRLEMADKRWQKGYRR